MTRRSAHFSASYAHIAPAFAELLTHDQLTYSRHHTYPFPIPELPESLKVHVKTLPETPGRLLNDQPDLDLVCYEPFIPSSAAKELFNFLRINLPFYRVEYDIQRGGFKTHIRTPRFTTVFGIDDTAVFGDDDVRSLLDAQSRKPLPADAYPKCKPRPIPQCLDLLRRATESATGKTFNFCLVNYYASGADSISFHSDDERFLGVEPAIASFSLGARRDFLMKHKPMPPSAAAPDAAPPSFKQIKLPLGSGDMVLMQGLTQSMWLHSIPKRSGRNENDGGRINITFRKAMVKGGTANYYHYNVGDGPVLKWDASSREMKPWKS
jgi:alkylated DNA repair dioxygenase AlkB